MRSAPQRDGTLYPYGVADILFDVFAKDPATAAEALGKLPWATLPVRVRALG